MQSPETSCLVAFLDMLLLPFPTYKSSKDYFTSMIHLGNIVTTSRANVWESLWRNQASNIWGSMKYFHRLKHHNFMSICCLIIVISTNKHFNKPSSSQSQLPFGWHFVEEFTSMTSRAFLVFVPHNLIDYAYSAFLVFCLFLGGQYILLSNCSMVTSSWNRFQFLIAMYCIESYKTYKTIN